MLLLFSINTSTAMSRKKKNVFKVKGDQLLDFVKEVIREGNIRRIIIRDSNGKK